MNAEIQAEVTQAKRETAIDIAVRFSATASRFEAGAVTDIKRTLLKSFQGLSKIRTQEDYERLHDSFCSWFIANIRAVGRPLKDDKSESPRPASYREAAKVIDTVANVYVYYCCQPSSTVAELVAPFLHIPITLWAYQHLLGKGDSPIADADTISSFRCITKEIYMELQNTARKKIDSEFNGELLPVQYYDIIWHRLRL